MRNVCDEDLLEMNLKAERLLDSPDSGLPPSPSVSPSPWLSGDRSTASSVCEDESRAATLAAVSFTHQTQRVTPNQVRLGTFKFYAEYNYTLVIYSSSGIHVSCETSHEKQLRDITMGSDLNSLPSLQ